MQLLHGSWGQAIESPQRSIGAPTLRQQPETQQKPAYIGGPLSPIEEECSIESDDDLEQPSTYLVN